MSRTGIVVAGFGSDEIFPTLVSFELEGVVAGGLKLRRTASCDISRNGTRAFVQPFAQKDMVERFLYGLDEGIQNEILRFCETSVSSISQNIFEKLTFGGDAEELQLRKQTHAAEQAFVKALREKAFGAIEEQARGEIEGMVEFMPKPELARMAEALVELTSIKRKVSVGVETVGGPVDVALISKSDGFVWVKRKHYFPPELNRRYFERLNGGGNRNRMDKDAK